MIAPDDPWPELDLNIPVGTPRHIREENVEAIRKLSEDSLKAQLDGGRLNIARCYTVLGQAATLTAAGAGGVGISSGATGATQGWVGHLSITLGFGVATVLWAASAAVALAAVLPRELSAAAVYPREVYTEALLTTDERELKLLIVRHFAASIADNASKLKSMRFKLKWALLLLAIAPIFGLATAPILHYARLLFLH